MATHMRLSHTLTLLRHPMLTSQLSMAPTLREATMEMPMAASTMSTQPLLANIT